MDVATISMPAEEAKQAYHEYRKATRNNPEDQAIMMGYRALARGQAVIDLTEAMMRAGIDDKGLPKFAVARADWKQVFFKGWGGGAGWFAREEKFFHYNFRSDASSIRFGNMTFPEKVGDYHWRHPHSIVPIIPPKLRPAHDLSNYVILWEAIWNQVPKDPLLLKHLTGDLYAVLAMWDLTELERTVLAARLRQ